MYIKHEKASIIVVVDVQRRKNKTKNKVTR
jgi:hypothetical protein